MNRLNLFYLLIALLTFTCCGGQRGELRIKGHFDHLNQVDFLIYRLDGQMEGLDTIHIIEGDFDYRTPVEDDATFQIIYPNFSTLTVFGGSGDVIEIEGDALHLTGVKVSGTDENERYTEYRLVKDSVPTFQKDSLRDALIDEFQESQLGLFLSKEKQLENPSPILKKGNALPAFKLKTRDGKTISNKDFKGKYLLISFWANWENNSSSVIYNTRKIRREAHKPLDCISYSLDTDPFLLKLSEDRDSIRWHSYCDFRSWQGELVQTLGIRDLPYTIFVGPNGKIIASGTDWNKDIESALSEIKN